MTHPLLEATWTAQPMHDAEASPVACMRALSPDGPVVSYRGGTMRARPGIDDEDDDDDGAELDGFTFND